MKVPGRQKKQFKTATDWVMLLFLLWLWASTLILSTQTPIDALVDRAVITPFMKGS